MNARQNAPCFTRGRIPRPLGGHLLQLIANKTKDIWCNYQHLDLPGKIEADFCIFFMFLKSREIYYDSFTKGHFLIGRIRMREDVAFLFLLTNPLNWIQNDI
jgi:hypothetical protein